MASWRRSLWAVGVGAVVATTAWGEVTAPAGTPDKEGVISTSKPSANVEKGQFLAKVQLYSDLAKELARLADQRAESAELKQLAKTWRADHLESNGRITQYVLTRRVNFPDAVLEGEEKERVRSAMIQLEALRKLEGAQFERSFAQLAAQLPSLAARDLMTARQRFANDAELLAVVDPLLAALDTHRKDAEALAQQFGGAAARRPIQR